MALRAPIIILSVLIAGGAANMFDRELERLLADPRILDSASELSSCFPNTGNLLIGRESRLSASSTCGSHGRERFCIVSHPEDRKKCFRCDSTNNTIDKPRLNHRIQNIIYKYHPGTRTETWWQSENGKENVTIQLDMEAEFHLMQLIIQFKTFRPAAMLVERSFDFGKTWHVYRYFAHNCDEAFPFVPKNTQRSLTEVVCDSRYSGVEPSTEGEVIFEVLPPNINVVNPCSEEVLNLSRMTNLRINFTKLHTLGDDLLDNRPEIQEKYYYAIYEMTVRGSCSCYGHASRCLPLPDVTHKRNMVHGRCECTHNTMGVNCERCEPTFYRDPNLDIQSPHTCKFCDCDPEGSVDYDCNVITGQCKCRPNVMGRRCNQPI